MWLSESLKWHVVHILSLLTTQTQIFGGRSIVGKRMGSPCCVLLKSEEKQTKLQQLGGGGGAGMKTPTGPHALLPEKLSEWAKTLHILNCLKRPYQTMILRDPNLIT